nr:sugar transporter ERD6-like 17 [Danaus plexippus plexippus]
MAILRQVLTTAIISYIFLTLGFLFSLPSFTLKLFSSENKIFDHILNRAEISLIGSMSSASPLIVVPFCGFLLDKLGRKKCLILFYLPQLFSWLLLISVHNVAALIFSMFLCGLSGAIFLIVPVYVTEYCQESIRGSMVASSLIFYAIGMTMSYICGEVLDYVTFNYLGLTTSAIGLLLMTFMRESPLYLMKKGLEGEAASAIGFFRSCNPKSKEVLEEMENLRRIINIDIDTIEAMPEEMKLKTLDGPTEKIDKWRYLAKSRSSRRALVIVMITCTTCCFQGLLVFRMYTKQLFEILLPNVSITLASVLFGIVSVIAGGFGAYFVDTIGRTLLLILASIDTSVCCVILGTQLQYNWGPIWLNLVLILLYTFGYFVGAGTVPFVLIGEVFLPEVLEQCSISSPVSVSLPHCLVTYLYRQRRGYKWMKFKENF